MSSPIPRADFFYHKNHQGSITEITDINGNIAKMYKYDAFGRKYFESGPSLVDEFAYTARQRHDRTGLYYYRNRFYNPQLGRFLSQDPIGITGGTNLYAYVGNSPVNYVDPLGLCDESIWDETKGAAIFVWDWVVPIGLSSYATTQLAELHPFAVVILPAMEMGGALYMYDIEQQYQKSRSDLNDTAARVLAEGVDPEVVQAYMRGVQLRSDATREAARLGTTAGISMATAGAKFTRTGW